MQYLDRITNFLLFVIGLMIVTGGYDLRLPNAYIELSQVSLWGLTFSLSCIWMHKKGYFEKSHTYFHVSKIYDYFITAAKSKLWLWILLLFGWLFIARLVRHYTLNTEFMDVSCVHQPLFYPFEPKLLHCDGCRNGTQMAEHIAWIFILISPLFSWLKSDISVFVFKYLAVVGILLYFLKAGPLKNRRELWILALLLLFCSKTFRSSLVWDFREDDLAFVFLLLSCCGLYRGKMIVYWLGLVLALICKENIAFVTVFFAPIILLVRESNLTKKQRLLHSFATAFVSLLYAFIVIKVFTPYFLQGAEHLNNIVLRFPGMGNSLEEVLINFITQPNKLVSFIVSHLFSLSSLKYIVLLIAPFVVLGIRAWPWLLGALPGILMNCLQASANQRMMIFHYDLIILPFLFMALSVSLSRLDVSRDKVRILFAFAVALSVFDRSPSAEIRERILSGGHRILPTIELSKIQLDGPVAANANIWAQLNHLSALRMLRFPSGQLNEDPMLARRMIVEYNPVRKPSEQGRDPADTKFVILNLESPWERFFMEDILNEGSKIIRQIPHNSPLYAVIALESEIFRSYCEQYSLCR